MSGRQWTAAVHMTSVCCFWRRLSLWYSTIWEFASREWGLWQTYRSDDDRRLGHLKDTSPEGDQCTVFVEHLVNYVVV